MMTIKRTGVLIYLSVLAAPAIGCGDETISSRAMELASVIVAGLVVLSALLLPLSIILLNKVATGRVILLLCAMVLSGAAIAVIMMVINSHPYMVPAAVLLLAASLFLPVLYLFVAAIRVFRQQEKFTASDALNAS